MTFPRFAYRARQFWNAVLKPDVHIKSEAILPYLSPSQLILFRQMQPSEQAHAYHVFNHLVDAGKRDPDLLAAALLHDVGKILSPLSIFDRIMIVVGRHLFPKAAKRWGEAAPHGLQRPFVVAACHAQWGADLVEQAGASSLTIELVRGHHNPPLENPVSKGERLLAELRGADEGN